MFHELKIRRSSILELLYKILDIREGEANRSMWMWLYIFCVIAALMIVKPMVNALFLSEFGAERLPLVFILVAIMAAAISVFYANLLKSGNLYVLITRTLYISMILFFLFWVFLSFNVM